MRQLTFPNMPKPKRPSMKTESVALAIAKRIVAAVNIENFYWKPDEIEDRVFDVKQEIIRGGRPDGVFNRLYRRRTFTNTTGRQVHGNPYGWDGLHSHCVLIANEITHEEREKAIQRWSAHYGKKS